jgi:putative flippase GtrA
VTIAWVRYARLRPVASEFAKFAVVGATGVVITNAVYDAVDARLRAGPVSSATIATVVAAVVTYLGNRYWSFLARSRAGVARELAVFAVLNCLGLLIQDAVVAFNAYALRLGHSRLAAFVALNAGIGLATLFRFWSYRRFVWTAPRPGPARPAGPGAVRRR